MRYPVIMFVGSAGAGKDTAAAILSKKLGGTVVSLADEIKRFTLNFGFSVDQLWGPSENRNRKDERFASPGFCRDAWNEVELSSGKWLNSLPFPKHLGEKVQERLDSCCGHIFGKAADDGGISARTVLQITGTEFGRHLHRDIWVDHALVVAKDLLGGGHRYSQRYGIVASTGSTTNCVLIPDGRFRSEIMAVRRQGGTVIRIVDADSHKKDIGGIQGHVSETEQDTIPDWYFDYVVVNDKSQGLDELEYRLNSIICHLTAVIKYG